MVVAEVGHLLLALEAIDRRMVVLAVRVVVVKVIKRVGI
jgi:hypothetical protein